jgi:hypothetical protein
MHIIPSTDTELSEYLAAKAAVDQANERLEKATRVLTERMEREHRKTYTLESGDRKATVTYTVRRTPVIDEAGLRKALRAPVFDKLTVRKLDRSKLEMAMSLGDVDPMIVAKYTAFRASEPFLTYRESEVHEQV